MDPQRVTGPYLDVLDRLVRAHPAGLHGYAIAAATRQHRSTVAVILRRLQVCGWTTVALTPGAKPGGRGRQVHTLTPAGAERAGRLLTERRPATIPNDPERSAA